MPFYGNELFQCRLTDSSSLLTTCKNYKTHSKKYFYDLFDRTGNLLSVRTGSDRVSKMIRFFFEPWLIQWWEFFKPPFDWRREKSEFLSLGKISWKIFRSEDHWLDERSRITFPLSFLIFNIAFWSYCLLSPDYDLPEVIFLRFSKKKILIQWGLLIFSMLIYNGAAYFVRVLIFGITK